MERSMSTTSARISAARAIASSPSAALAHDLDVREGGQRRWS
jgi:hypothetical protein